ncbi:MAG: DNA-binding response regulator [Ignavibacteria bacterium RBG_13_36_8]|nr:MAG: DNA-binding response regulator [Ignavibacteria bacterium RBG_13_36_8]
MSKDILKGSKILLVEDEESLAMGLRYNLTEEGYSVTWVKNGKEAIKKFDSVEFDLMILDIMLPHVDGFEVAQYVRERNPQIPILMLTAMTRTEDKIKGLELGADDYVAKPFHLDELLLRIKGMLRRKAWYKTAAGLQPVFRFGDNEINFEDLTCTRGEHKFRLTPHEAMALKYLLDNKGKIVSRKELLEKVWDISSEIETRTIDNFIVRLRKYIEPDPSKPIYIKSIRGAGYMFSE